MASTLTSAPSRKELAPLVVNPFVIAGTLALLGLAIGLLQLDPLPATVLLCALLAGWASAWSP